MPYFQIVLWNELIISLALTTKLRDDEILDFLNNSDAELSDEEDDDINEIRKNIEEIIYEDEIEENIVVIEENPEIRNRNNAPRDLKWLKKKFVLIIVYYNDKQSCI